MQKQLLHDEIPIAVVWDKNLTDKDKLVFGEIFTMINQGKPFIMSNKHMAIRLNCSPRTISKSVSHLIKADWIKTRNLKSKTGSTEYRQIYGINLLRALKFSSRVHGSISLGVHDKNFHQIDQNNTSVNKSVREQKIPGNEELTARREKRCQAQVDYFVKMFEKHFAEYPGLKFEQYVARWLFRYHYSPVRITKAMQKAEALCRTSNPNAIGSYMNGCLQYPMKPKKSKGSSKPKYHSRGDHDDSKYNHKARF